jgi:cytochrome c oxidase subunit 2
MWNFPLFPEQASTLAGWVDAVFLYEMVLCVFFTTLICALIVFFSLKYRKGSRADRSNPVNHNTPLEIFWMGVPLTLAMILFFAATYVYFHLYNYPRDATEIYVLGRQWMWETNHKEGRREIDTLHVPVGRPIRLTMTSEDVIHSFYIPAFRIKQDVLPGRYTSMWFQATKPGTYHLFCAEYCGTSHSRMIGSVVVMEPAEFQDWLASGSTRESMATEGEKLFRSKGCSGCHGRNATVRAPMLEGVFGHAVPLSTGQFVTADERYVRDSIRLPRSQVVAGYDPVMPTFDDRLLTESDLLKLISYIKSLSDTELDRGARR